MVDPGQLFCDEELMPIYNGGGCQPFASFSKKGGELPYLDPVVIQNLLNQTPPAVETTPVQAAVLSMLTMHKKESAQADFVCISETGSGKTYAFLLPAIETALKRIRTTEEPPTPSVLIFCHTQPLAESIYQNLNALAKDTPIKTCLIVGKTEFIKSAEFDIGVCCAGRFRNHFGGNSKRYVQIDVSKLDLLVVDELDASMKCSEDFLLYSDIRKKATCPAFFFSATFDATFSFGDIFRDDNGFMYQHGELNSLPPTVRPVFWECDRSIFPSIYLDDDGSVHAEPRTVNNVLQKCNPSDMIYHIMAGQWKNRPNTKFMVFTKKTSIADFLANKMAILRIKARAIHAKKSLEQRHKSLNAFKSGEVKVLFATTQFTRGFDADVDVVINYDIPSSLTAWIHRSGRVGRNGKKGAAITLVDVGDHDEPSKMILRKIVEKINNQIKIPSFLTTYLEQ
uniref:ATP-dependent RNA helicase n=1 Tax=Panagrellus redivivus TaxID=6233 RepID=A0A7E4VMR0_PANRE